MAACARRAPANDVQNFVHIRLKLLVDKARVRLGIIAQMNAFGRGGVHGAHKILIDFLGHKRDHRCGQFGERRQRSIQRQIGVDFVLGHFRTPIAFAAAADIPIGEFVGKGTEPLWPPR